MRIKHLMLAATLATICCAQAAQAASPTSKFENYGLGTHSCGAYLTARKDNNYRFYEAWLTGFLTAQSWWASLVHKTSIDFLKGTDLYGAMYWLDNYCHAHPMRPFERASSDFAVTEYNRLYSSRPIRHAAKK